MWHVSASTAHVDFDSTADATALGSGTNVYPAGIPLRHHALDAAKSSWCLISSSPMRTSCLQRVLVAERVLAAHVQHLGGDEPLDEAEHVRVGAALDLAQEPLFARAEEVEAVDLSTARREEALIEVEAPPADDVAVDVEADALRHLDDFRVAHGVDVGLQNGLRHWHGKSPGGKWEGHGWDSIEYRVVGIALACWRGFAAFQL
jgi:hypothetical protein